MPNWFWNIRFSNIIPTHYKLLYLSKIYNKYWRSWLFSGSNSVFLKHTIDLPERAFEHNLAYVRWYKPASARYHFSIDDDEQTCNVELWSKDFYPKSRDCIIPVHHILGRFVPVKYKVTTRQNTTEYLAVNQLIESIIFDNKIYHIIIQFVQKKSIIIFYIYC